MDVSTILAVVAIVAVNAVGWVISYGRLSQKVENTERILNNGLCDKVDGMSRSLANLEGTVNTFMEMYKEREKD